MFNEQSLRLDVESVFGPAGAHVDVLDSVLSREAAYRAALEEIADADIRRCKAGWLQKIAKRAIGRET